MEGRERIEKGQTTKSFPHRHEPSTKRKGDRHFKKRQTPKNRPQEKSNNSGFSKPINRGEHGTG